jgi:CelD/BcsL family acetyltransferase involved in cellulose biosynthesis
MDPPTDRYEAVADFARFLELEDAWNALSERVPGSYFSQSFEWCRVGWEQVAVPRRRRLHCLTGYRGGQLVLVWPFVTYRWKLWTFAQPLGSETTEYTSPLALEDGALEHRVTQAWQFLRRSCGTDIILLPHVRDDSPLSRVLSQYKTAAPPDAIVTRYVSWEECRGWDGYVASLKRSHRGDLRRTRRRISEIGRLSFEPIVHTSQCAATIDWIIQHKTQWLSRKDRRNAWLPTSEYRNFLIKITGSAAAAGRVVVSVLRLDDKVIAANVSRVDRTRVECLNTVYDRALAKYGIGQLLMEECIKWAFKRQLIYDLRIGEEAYKGDWANGTCTAITFEYANSSKGVPYFWLRYCASNARWLVPAPLRRFIKAVLRKALQRTGS